MCYVGMLDHGYPSRRLEPHKSVCRGHKDLPPVEDLLTLEWPRYPNEGHNQWLATHSASLHYAVPGRPADGLYHSRPRIPCSESPVHCWWRSDPNRLVWSCQVPRADPFHVGPARLLQPVQCGAILAWKSCVAAARKAEGASRLTLRTPKTTILYRKTCLQPTQVIQSGVGDETKSSSELSVEKIKLSTWRRTKSVHEWNYNTRKLNCEIMNRICNWSN